MLPKLGTMLKNLGALPALWNLTWESYVEQPDFWTLFRLGNPAWEPWNLTQAPSLGTWKPLLRTLELIWRAWSGSLETLLNWELENLAAEVWNVTWKTLEPGFENLALRTVLILQAPRFQSKISGETVHKSGSQVPKHIQGEHALRWQQVSVVRR